MTEFTHEVKWIPGHAMRGEYGRSSLQCRMILHGPVGSMEWRWRPGPTPKRVAINRSWGRSEEWISSPASGAVVGYHFDHPTSFQLDTGTDTCDLRPLGRCYWDGSYTAADELLELFLIDGEDALWAALQEHYDNRRGELVDIADLWSI